MKRVATLVAGAAAALALAAPLASQAQDRGERSGASAFEERRAERGERELTKLLWGRVAGEPQDCIRTLPTRSLRIVDGTAVVYDAGSTIWVNRTRNPLSLDDNDALLIRKFGSGTQLCRLDQVTTFERVAGFYTGNIFLTEFVPYRREERAAR